MAKKIFIKIRIIGIVFFTVAFICLLVIKAASIMGGYTFEVLPMLYWNLFFLIVLVSTYSFADKIILPLGILTYILGSALYVFSIERISELLLRMSLIFFLVGVVGAIARLKRSKIN